MADSPTASVPIVDGHCHPPLRPPGPRDALELLGLFAESREPAAIAQAAETLYVRRALRDLAALHACAPTLPAILAARQALAPGELMRRCVERAGVVALLLDDGYRAEDCYPVGDLAELLAPACQAQPVLRLEPLLERLLAASPSFAALEEGFDDALADPRRRGIVALKSIVAYRSGLALGPPDRRAAAAAYAAVKRRPFRVGARQGAPVAAVPPRLVEKPLLDYFLARACRLAARDELPLQLHTGFGDADLDLLQANPLLLRPALEAETLAGVPLVLLHCYPYLREAAYLASLYGAVYVDVSLTLPLVGPGGQRAVEEVLELAPTSKVLYGSDAAGLAESIWLGALAIRRALDGALGNLLAAGALLPAEATRIAEQVLWRNAVALYGLPIATGPVRHDR